MKIHLVSDLHLECEHQELPGGEVLILAGDIAESRTIARHKKGFEQDPAGILTGNPYRAWTFFKEECAKYEKVFYVMGNHEHYHGRFDKTYHELKVMMPDNVVVLENEVFEYNGVMFLGATLWTDCNKHDPITEMTLKHGMNDYNVITNFYASKNIYHKLTPEHTAGVHRKTLQYFKLVLEDNRDKPFVVITHHAPSFASVNEKYAHEKTMNGGYASELTEFVLDHTNIKVWVHGHMHDSVDYMIENTRVLSHPRGYYGFEYNAEVFEPNCVFEI